MFAVLELREGNVGTQRQPRLNLQYTNVAGGLLLFGSQTFFSSFQDRGLGVCCTIERQLLFASRG